LQNSKRHVWIKPPLLKNVQPLSGEDARQGELPLNRAMVVWHFKGDELVR